MSRAHAGRGRWRGAERRRPQHPTRPPAPAERARPVASLTP
jgi:hypothetical protein